MSPDPPYYAVIFTSRRTEIDEGYSTMAEKMVALASQQPGFIGVDSVRDSQGRGITVSYWRNLTAIKAWKKHPEHQKAQRLGRKKWYRDYTIRIGKVERVDAFNKDS